jgi:hypothetical protein
MKLPFSKTRAIIAQIIQDIFLRNIDNRYIANSKSAFSITGYSDIDNCIYLYPEQQKPLYGIKVERKSNIPLEITYLKRLMELFGGDTDARLFIFYSKSPVLFQNKVDNFCTKNSLYIFSHSKTLIKELSNFYNADLLKPIEIVRGLLDIGLNNRYMSDSDSLDLKAIHELNEIPEDELFYIFKTIFAEGVYDAVSKDSNSSYKVYQAVGTNSFFTHNKPDLISVLSYDWRGYLEITLELNSTNIGNIIRAKRSLSSKIDTDKEIKKGFRLLEEKFNEEPTDFVVANMVYVMDNDTILQQVSEDLNISFIEKRAFKKDILYRTPILERDVDFDFIVKTEDAKKFLSAFLLSNNRKRSRVAESAGKDITNNYTTFSFYETALPHTGIIAKARSGKTFFIQNTIFDALRADIVKDENYIPDNRTIIENSPVLIKEAKRLESDEVGIVHFDVGHSAEKSVNQLKKRYPNKVDIYADNLNLLRFGLTNVRAVDNNGKVEIHKSDALFMVQTINTILELSGQELLSANESNKVINALAKLFAERKYAGLTIEHLKQIGGYDELLDRLDKELGGLDDYATTVELNLSKEYNFLQVPLLSDVITELEFQKANFRGTKEDNEIIAKAVMKLKSFEENPMFWYYAKNNISDASYFYMELESIKKLGDQIFIPVYLMMFQALYRRDIERALKAKNMNKDAKEVIYIIEEAHNFFKVSSFKKMFDELSREAARYGIVLVFITQNANDIPEDILINLGNKIIMPTTGEDKELQINEIPYLFQLENEQNKAIKEKVIDFFKRYSKQYSAFIQNANGVSTFAPYASKEKVWLFNSDAVAKQY